MWTLEIYIAWKALGKNKISIISTNDHLNIYTFHDIFYNDYSHQFFVPVGDGIHRLHLLIQDVAGNLVNVNYMFITEDSAEIISGQILAEKPKIVLFLGTIWGRSRKYWTCYCCINRSKCTQRPQ